MKKQTLTASLLLTSLILLSGCPESGDQTGTASPGSSPAALTATFAPPPSTPPSGPPLTALTEFPDEHLSCCWDQLQTTDPNYQKLALNALNGDLAALETLLLHSGKLELTPSYAHGAVLTEILHRIGDARFAWVVQKLAAGGQLAQVNKAMQETLHDTLRNLVEGGFALNTDTTIHRQGLDDYPETARLLYYQIEAKKK